MPVTSDDIAALISHPLQGQIPKWQDLPTDPVQRVVRLRAAFPAEIIPAVLELSDLRHRAAMKFACADAMFFDREGLEQATGENIAKWRARSFSGLDCSADLTCGVGGDVIEMTNVTRVLASDLNPSRLAMARANVELYNPTASADFRAAPAEKYPLAEGYFLDPSRRAAGKRTRHLVGISPSIELIQELIRKSQYVGVKLSPATPDNELDGLGGSVEFISDHGTCKEAVVWFGKLAGQRKASILPSGVVLEADANVPEPPLCSHAKYIFEPDPAIVRAGLIPELCKRIDAAVMDRFIAYLTINRHVNTPFGRCYETLASLPFSEKAIRGALRGLDIGQVVVKKRGTAVDLERIRKNLQSDLPGRGVVIMTRIGVKPWAYICRPATE